MLTRARAKQLTVAEIRRRRCSRCRRRPGYATWDCCADGNRRRVICLRCDIALNRLVLTWMRDPRAAKKIAAYVKQLTPPSELLNDEQQTRIARFKKFFSSVSQSEVEQRLDVDYGF